jgi:hypothetical protein
MKVEHSDFMFLTEMLLGAQTTWNWVCREEKRILTTKVYHQADKSSGTDAEAQICFDA